MVVFVRTAPLLVSLSLSILGICLLERKRVMIFRAGGSALLPVGKFKSWAEQSLTHHAGNVAVLSEELPQGRHLDVPRPGGVREVGPGGQTEHPSHTSDTSDIELPVCLLDVESIIRLLTLKLVSWAGADRAL